jgi:hypothetical protein
VTEAPQIIDRLFTENIDPNRDLLNGLALRAVSATPPHVLGIGDSDLAHCIRNLKGRWADFVPRSLADNWDALSDDARIAAFVSALDYAWSSDGPASSGM